MLDKVVDGSNQLSSPINSIEKFSPKNDNIVSINEGLQYEYETIMSSYENILRSCLGDYCFNSRPEKSRADRIGILGPSNSGGSIITQIVKKIISIEHPRVDTVEVVDTTNVPPYGYGKNHGWNRIIRYYIYFYCSVLIIIILLYFY